MKNKELIARLQKRDLESEIVFTVFGHWYNPTKDRLSHGELEIKFAKDECGDRVLYIGKGLPYHCRGGR